MYNCATTCCILLAPCACALLTFAGVKVFLEPRCQPVLQMEGQLGAATADGFAGTQTAAQGGAPATSAGPGSASQQGGSGSGAQAGQGGAGEGAPASQGR